MAIFNDLDDETLSSLTKKLSLVSRDKTDTTSKKVVSELSNTVTGIQNAFNRILTYSKNLNKIQQAKLEDTALFNKEQQLEAPRGTSITPATGGQDLTSLMDILPKMVKIVKSLDGKLENLDLSQSGNMPSMPTPRGGIGLKGLTLGLGAAAAGTAAYMYATSDDEMPVAPEVVEPTPLPPISEEEAPFARAGSLEAPEPELPRTVQQAQTKSLKQEEKLVNASVKAATRPVATPVQKAQPTSVKPSDEGRSWTGKVSSFIGETYKNVTAHIGAFLSTLAARASQFFTEGGQGLAGMLGYGGGPGFQAANLQGARGDWSRDTAFVNGVNALAQKWNIDASDLLGLMGSESGENINAQARNPSGATGIIQFMPGTARAMGTSTEAIGRLTRAQQLPLVDQYFRMNNLPKGASAGQLYATVFLPAYNNRSPNFVVARRGGPNDAGKNGNGSWYSQNAGLDVNRDGAITIADLGARVSQKRMSMGLGASQAGGGFRAVSNAFTGALGSVASFGRGLFQQATSAITGPGQFIVPVSNIRITSGFGPRHAPAAGASRFHQGIDFGPSRPGTAGDAVYASADGTVTKAGAGRGYGNVVYIDHGRGFETRYAHLMAFTTMQGQRVRKGQQIGIMGNTGVGTGPHLHFEIRRQGQAFDPRRLLSTSAPVRPDPSASEPGNEQRLSPGAKPGVPVTKQVTPLAQDAQTVAIQRRQAAQRAAAPRGRGASPQGRGGVVAGTTKAPPAPQKKTSPLGQFLSYFGAN